MEIALASVHILDETYTGVDFMNIFGFRIGFGFGICICIDLRIGIGLGGDTWLSISSGLGGVGIIVYRYLRYLIMKHVLTYPIVHCRT